MTFHVRIPGYQAGSFGKAVSRAERDPKRPTGRGKMRSHRRRTRNNRLHGISEKIPTRFPRHRYSAVHEKRHKNRDRRIFRHCGIKHFSWIRAKDQRTSGCETGEHTPDQAKNMVHRKHVQIFLAEYIAVSVTGVAHRHHNTAMAEDGTPVVPPVNMITAGFSRSG